MALRTVRHHQDASPQRSAALDLGAKKLREMVAQASDLACSRCYHDVADSLATSNNIEVANFWTEQRAKIESLSPNAVAKVFRDWVDSQLDGLGQRELKGFIIGLTTNLSQVSQGIG